MIPTGSKPRHLGRQLFAGMLALGLTCMDAAAQGVIARATQRVASVTADLALARAVTVDLSAGMSTVPHDALQVGVSSVDVVNGSAVRIHLAFLNGSDVAVALQVPADSAFVLLDATGRRFTLTSVRSRTARGGNTITVPALERVEVNLVYLLNASPATEAILKIGPTVLRGIPIRREPTSAASAAPVAPSPPPAAAPPDSGSSRA